MWLILRPQFEFTTVSLLNEFAKTLFQTVFDVTVVINIIFYTIDRI